MALDARQLKARYASKWRLAARRELLVLSVLNIYLPEGYRAVPTGLGSLSDDYIPQTYNDVLEAFDIVVLYGQRIVAFLDVTGVSSAREMQSGKGLCAGIWKLWKAEKYGIKDRAWIVHVLEERAALRFAKLDYLEKRGKQYRLRSDEHPLICMESKYWQPLNAFLRWLTSLNSI